LAASWIRHAPPREPTSELDAETFEACRRGCHRALRLFVLRYQSMVFAFLSRTLGAGPHVEDLAQEVFLRACRGLASFDAGGAARPSTWLLTIASRVAIDARRRRRVPTAPLDAEFGVSSPETPETERRRVEIGRALARAAAQLSDEQRDAFVLAEFHDLDTKAIAAVLGVREATAKTRLFRARERLRELLRRDKEEL
jgi:RNA polymerase sigma-70 factor (ECF subfamily)